MTDKPKKNYIPKLRQLTPEMEARNKERASRIRRAKRREDQLKRFGVSLLIIGVPALAIGYTYLATRHDDTESRRDLKGDVVASSDLQNNFESLLENGTEAELFGYAEENNQAIMTGELPKQLLAYQERVKIADALLARDKVSEETVELAILKKIDALVSLASLNHSNGLNPTDVINELLRVSTEHVSSTNPSINEQAHLGLAIANVHQFVTNDSAANFELAQKSLEELFQAPISLSRQHLVVLYTVLGLPKNKDNVFELRKCLVEKLRLSSNPEQQNLASVLNDELRLGPRDFEMLRHLVSMSNSLGITEMQEIVAAITATPDLSFGVYQNIVSALDSVRESKRNELESGLRAELKTAAAKISVESSRLEILKLLDDYETRLNLIGTEFPLNSGAPAEQQLDPNASATAITFLRGDSQLSLNFLKTWSEYDMPDVDEQFLIVSMDDETPKPEQLAKFQAAFPQALFITAPFNKFYMDRCPVSFAPYTVVLDGTQTVQGVNVSLGKFRELLSSFREPFTDPNQPLNED